MLKLDKQIFEIKIVKIKIAYISRYLKIISMTIKNILK